MALKVNPAVYASAAFVLPAAVVDEHLRRAGGQQLKVLLFMLRHGGEPLSEEAVSAGTGLSVPDVKDAAQYWVETGFLTRDGAPAAPLKTAPAAPAVSGQKDRPSKSVADLPETVPSYEEVAARTKESAEICGLFQEAQAKLGRTIGYSNQAKLLMMVDDYGLPPEVILTIIEYAAAHGKANMSYIVAVGRNWAADGIDSLEQAMGKLEQMERADKLWKEFENSFTRDKPRYTEARAAYVRKWREGNKQSLELIHYAYEEMINQIDKVSYKYWDSILTRWHDEGLKKPADVLQDAKNRAGRNKASGTKAAAPKNASYDAGEYRRKAQGPVKYEPKNRK